MNGLMQPPHLGSKVDLQSFSFKELERAIWVKRRLLRLIVDFDLRVARLENATEQNRRKSVPVLKRLLDEFFELAGDRLKSMPVEALDSVERALRAVKGHGHVH